MRPAAAPRASLARLTVLASLAALASLLFALFGPAPRTGAQEADEEEEGGAQGEEANPATSEILCNEQEPQSFLIRGNWDPRGHRDPAELRARRAVHEKAIRYRTEQYGHFPGFGQAEWNANHPSHYVRTVRVFGRQTRMNERVIPAVRCAAQQIARSCTEQPYEPRRLSGIRPTNTYHNGEVSNHVYGIALDIDPTLNTCCSCVAAWGDHPLCQQQVRSIFERMAMPECWVHAFERYGFYWLGHDRLMDTMHFEFLGDPDRILRSGAGSGE